MDVSEGGEKAAGDGERPFVSVIVPHYHDLKALDLCLATLRAQTYPNDRYEVIVADNDSPEGREVVAAVVRDRARLVWVPERGAGPARNGAVAIARGEILAFTDSDCVVDFEWLTAGVRALADADLVGGRVLVLIEASGRPSPAEAYEAVFAFDNQRYVEQLGFTVTANLFCSAGQFAKVGGFRSGVSEDVDWSRRARAQGFRLVYVPEAIVGHPARRTWAELTKKWRRINIEAFGLGVGEPLNSLRWFLRSLLLPPSALVHTPRVLFSKELTSWSQRMAALGVLYRLRSWRCMDALNLLRNPPSPTELID